MAGGMPSSRILLTDGKPQALPTDDSTAVRVRVLDKADRLGTPDKGEIQLAVEITPEPKLRWQKTVAVHIKKALDDQGQSLTQVLPATEAPAGLPGGRFGGGQGGAGGFPGGLPPGAGIAIGGTGHDQSRITPIHLKEGAQSAKSLKEISGNITAQVLLEPKPLITVTDVLKSAGKTIQGTAGGSIKVLSIQKMGTGRMTIRFELEPPAGAALAGRVYSVSPSAEGVILTNGDGTTPESPHQVFSLVDDKGNFLPPVGTGINTNPAKGIEYDLTYQPQKDQGEPAKLVFSISKSVTIDVPFTLKNVPLQR
jgi:hypothetical protein